MRRQGMRRIVVLAATVAVVVGALALEPAPSPVSAHEYGTYRHYDADQRSSPLLVSEFPHLGVVGL